MTARNGRIRILAALLGMLAAPPVLAEPNLGDVEQFERLQDTLARVADEVRPSVVAIRADRRITTYSERFRRSRLPDDEVHRSLIERIIPAVGTGAIIRADGLILTNEHVIRNAAPEDIEIILSSGDTFAVEEITSDPRSDLAVLRIEARDLRPVRLGDAGEVRQGHFAIVMGNPFGSASENRGRPAMTFGIISALSQVLTEQLDPSDNRYYGNLIQTDARINPGNSGGPLLNMRGEVIGVTTAISTRSGGSDGIGYAIPMDRRTKDIISELSAGREIEYGFLGVRLDPPSSDHRRQAGGPPRGGALVVDVDPGTPAHEANLQPGDIIVRFDGTAIRSVDQLVRLVGAARVGLAVDVELYRDRKSMSVKVTPARRDVIAGVNIYSWRGMKLVNASSDMREALGLAEGVEGVIVTHVDAGGAAARAGVVPGQFLKQIGDVPIHSLRELRELAPQLTGSVDIRLDRQTRLELPPD